jgi:PAP2 superfamily
MLCMYFLYLTTDSLLAYKSALITCIGYYILTFLKLIYKNPRPFWLSEEIHGLDCRFDFGGPSYNLYTLTTFWAYNIIMYRMKYADPPVNKKIVAVLISVLVVFGVWVIISSLHQGTSYLYQNFMGLLYGIMLLVLVINFD